MIADEGAAAADKAVKTKITDVIMNFSPGSAGVDKAEMAICLKLTDGLDGTVRNITFFALGQDRAVNIKKRSLRIMVSFLSYGRMTYFRCISIME